MEIVAFGVIGILSGLVAGLVGLAGGIVVVPALTWLYGTDILIDAIIVSWFAVFFNSISAAWKQLKVRTSAERNALYFDARYFLIGAVVITPMVAMLFSSTRDFINVKVVAILQLCLAGAMLIPVKPLEVGTNEARPRKRLDVLFGGIIGGVSTLIGVGGGTYTVAYFVMVAKRKFQDAIATANLTGLVIGTLSILGYATSSLIPNAHASSSVVSHSPMPFVGAVVLIAGGLISAPWGVNLSRRLPTKLLKRILIGAIVLSSTKLLFS